MWSLDSAQSVVAATEEFHKAQVSEDLKLLTDFVSYETVSRVKCAKLFLKGIDLSQRKLLFAQVPNDIQNIQCPTSLVMLHFRKWPQPCVLSSDYPGAGCDTFHN
jgi:hypothetical protein